MRAHVARAAVLWVVRLRADVVAHGARAEHAHVGGRAEPRGVGAAAAAPQLRGVAALAVGGGRAGAGGGAALLRPRRRIGRCAGHAAAQLDVLAAPHVPARGVRRRATTGRRRKHVSAPTLLLEREQRAVVRLVAEDVRPGQVRQLGQVERRRKPDGEAAAALAVLDEHARVRPLGGGVLVAEHRRRHGDAEAEQLLGVLLARLAHLEQRRRLVLDVHADGVVARARRRSLAVHLLALLGVRLAHHLLGALRRERHLSLHVTVSSGKS